MPIFISAPVMVVMDCRKSLQTDKPVLTTLCYTVIFAKKSKIHQ